MQQLTNTGILTKHLVLITPPTYLCLWKGDKNSMIYQQQHKKKVREVSKPGECITVDQLESLGPGFIGELKGSTLPKNS
jgi:hypothetical protein